MDIEGQSCAPYFCVGKIRIMKKLLLIVMAFVGTVNADAQVITGEFSDNTVAGKMLYLEAVSGRRTTMVDSTKIDQSLEFRFNSTRRETGVYRLSFDRKHQLDIISNATEDIVQLDFEGMDLLEGLSVIQSEENRAFGEFNYLREEMAKKKREINAERKKVPKNNKAQRELLSVRKDVLDKQFGKNTQPLMEAYPNTYFARLAKCYQFPDYEAYQASGAKKTYPSEKAFLTDRFFDTVDFTDIGLTKSTVYKDRIYKYLVRYTQYNEPGLIRSVDKIMGLAEGHDSTKEHILNYFLDHFNANGPKLMLQFVLENYLLDESCSEMDVEERYRMMAGEYQNLLPGNKAPNLQIADDQGGMLDIAKVAAGQKGTLLFFWSSHCHYCEQAMPSVKKLYEQYKAKGLEIVGVSLDTNEQAWKAGIAKNTLTWKQASELKGYKSQIALDYRIHKTPYFYLLDSDMQIVGKPNGITALENALMNMLP